jgi:hypothetical protein
MGYIEAFNPLDFGAVHDGVTDDTAAIQAAITAAGVVRGRVVFPSSTVPWIAAGLNISTGMTGFSGDTGGGMTRFGTGGQADGPVVIKRPAAKAGVAVLTLSETAPLVSNVVIDGGGVAGAGLVITDGFESCLHRVRVANVAGIGIDVQAADNTDWKDVYVDNCGTTSLPAVQVNPVSPHSINTFDVDGLTIERAAGVFLALGTNTDDNVAEILRISRLHMEASTDNGGVANVGPMLLMANARSVVLGDPFIYGGAGELIRFDRTATDLGSARNGLTIVGGYLSGRNADTNLMPDRLVHLVSGDGFQAVGTKFDNSQLEPVLIDAGFGPNATVTGYQTTRSNGGNVSTLVDDQRPSRNPNVIYGDLKVQGALLDVVPAQAAPLLAGNYYAAISSTPSTVAMAEGRVAGSRFVVARTATITKIGLELTAAGAVGTVIRLGIYRIDLSTGAATLVIDAGTIDGTVLGYAELGVSAPVTQGDTLILVACRQGGSATAPTVRSNSGSDPFWGDSNATTVGATPIVGVQTNGVSGAFPTSFAPASLGSPASPRVLVKV